MGGNDFVYNSSTNTRLPFNDPAQQDLYARTQDPNATSTPLPSGNTTTAATVGFGDKKWGQDYGALVGELKPLTPVTAPLNDEQTVNNGIPSFRSTWRGGHGSAGARAYGVNTSTGRPEQMGRGRVGLQVAFDNQLRAAERAMQAAGIGSWSITDGYRSYAAQVDVRRRKPTLAAVPGTSIHGIGYAADLNMTAAQSQWLARHGASFGLIRPVNGESWHVQLDPGYIRYLSQVRASQAATAAQQSAHNTIQ